MATSVHSKPSVRRGPKSEPPPRTQVAAERPAQDDTKSTTTEKFFAIVEGSIDQHIEKLTEAVKRLHLIADGGAGQHADIAEVKAALDALCFDAGYLFRDLCQFASQAKKRMT